MYKIKESCSGCHTCELVCPMQAVYYDGPRYQIDPEGCVGCGLCEKLCPTCSIWDPDEVKAVEPHDRIVRECDVVVCGGGSGLVAAIKAAQLGKKVILLEKARRVGGNTDFAHGFFPVYSKLHAEYDTEDMREEAVHELSRRTGGVIGEELIRTAVYGCQEFFDWLLDFPGARDFFTLELLGEKRAMGPVFGPAVIHNKARCENPRSLDPSIGPGWSGTFVKNAMLEAIPAQKLDVEILLEHEAKHLLLDEAGEIAGVVAGDPGGETEVRAKAVILATGGFGMSDEKLRKYTDFFDEERRVTRFSVPSDTGDAIDMLRELGVEPVPERMFLSMFGPAHHPYSYCLYRLCEDPSTLSVDLNGVRWQDETGSHMTGGKNIVGHPLNVSWCIYTQKNIDAIFRRFLQDPTLSDETVCYENYQQDLEREAGYRNPPVAIADTIEELAVKMGVDPAALVNTVNNYNRWCREGRDPEFGKDPRGLVSLEAGPYYAIYTQRFSEAAMGGLMVDGECRVLRNDGSFIPGLYGVGDATSAMHRRGELAVVSELTWAFASAYRSAVNAVKEMEGEA